MGKESLRAAAAGSPISPRRKRRGVSASTDPEPEALKDVLAADDEGSPRPRSAPECLDDPRWRCIVLQLQNATASSLFGRLTHGKVLRASGRVKKELQRRFLRLTQSRHGKRPNAADRRQAPSKRAGEKIEDGMLSRIAASCRGVSRPHATIYL